MALTGKFIFERDKITTKITKKDITSDRTQYNKHTSAATMQNALHGDLPFSASGQTLLTILALSYPNNLSINIINKVKSAWLKTTVKYSCFVTRSEGPEGDKEKEMKVMRNGLNSQIESPKAICGMQEGIIVTWQAPHLVFHGA